MKSSSSADATAADATGAKIRARVLLRVKRRRPSPTTTATSVPCHDCPSPSMVVGNKKYCPDSGSYGRAIAPDRIQLVLPSLDLGGISSKRRKIDKGEEMTLVQGFISAVSFHQSAESDDGTNKSLPPLQTPSMESIGNRIMNDDPKKEILLVEENSLTNKTHHRDEWTPAPPTKPKRRRAIFRKITDDLQKRFDPPPPPLTPTISTGNTMQVPVVPFSKENVYNAASAVAAVESPETWSSKGEEKSKWLRIVDVMLKEEEEEDHDGFICNSHDGDFHNNNDGGIFSSGNGIAATESGQQVRRNRPYPRDASDIELVNGNCHDGEGQRKKRRKLGLLVEQSRTVLESDFWNQPQAGNNFLVLDHEVVQLIEYSLTALHQQGGGSVMPHLSFLKNDPRLCYEANTPRGKMMVNHALSRGIDLPSAHDGAIEQDVGKGRTVLHIAALWGDLVGVSSLLGMGADPTIFDSLGYTPAGLARKGGYDDVVAALVKGERMAIDEKNIRWDGNAEEEYYYDVYCLEGDAENEMRKVDGSCGEENKSHFLPLKGGTSHVNTDSIPDLEHSANLSEDDSDTNSSGNRSRWTSVELQKGFGYWNEQGELILEVSGDDTKQSGDCYSRANNDSFVDRFFHNGDIDGDDSMGSNGDDSNDEGYVGNDYPDDISNRQHDSDDYDDYRDADACIERTSHCSEDSGDDWRLDFRHRFISKNVNNYGCFGDEGFSDDVGTGGDLYE